MTDKCFCRETHFLPTAVVAVIAPFKSDLSILRAQNTIVGNCYPVSVASQIFHHTVRIFEGWFAVDDPFFGIAIVKQRRVYVWNVLLEQCQKLTRNFPDSTVTGKKNFF